MIANTVIHSIDTSKGECILSIYDDGVLVCGHVNVGIDPSGNTSSTISMVSELLRQYRYDNLKI
tara:strand:+ start:142 stop:333 length:192 start_codon:yes stop_codon:yes gene_type:complete